MEYFVIGEDDMVLGFRYAGLDGRAVSDAASARDALAYAIEQKPRGLIVSQHVTELIRDEVNDLRVAPGPPVVVEAPGPDGPVEGRPTLLRLIQEAIGIRV